MRKIYTMVYQDGTKVCTKVCNKYLMIATVATIIPDHTRSNHTFIILVVSSTRIVLVKVFVIVSTQQTLK